jgi:hypothetical protein
VPEISSRRVGEKANSMKDDPYFLLRVHRLKRGQTRKWNWSPNPKKEAKEAIAMAKAESREKRTRDRQEGFAEYPKKGMERAEKVNNNKNRNTARIGRTTALSICHPNHQQHSIP